MPGFLIPIGTQFFDDNGDPLDGGKLYGYAAGTTTPLPFYTTQDLNVAHANPAILDAAGRLAAFIEDGVSYKFRLFDANDVLIDEWDEVAFPAVEAPTSSEEPAGVVKGYAGSSAPTGYLLCDGSAVSRTTYAALWTAIGSTFGNGNGTTTFNVPDLRGRFLFGKATSGTGAALGDTFGQIDHVHAGPSHTHTIPGHTHTQAHTHTVAKNAFGPAVTAPTLSDMVDEVLLSGGGGGGAYKGTAAATTSGVSAANTGSTSLTTDASGSGNTAAANPPGLSLNFIIKV